MVVVPNRGIDDTSSLKSKLNSTGGPSSVVLEQENIDETVSPKNTEITHLVPVPDPVPVPVPVSKAPPNLSGFMGTKSKASTRQNKVEIKEIKIPKIAIIDEVKEVVSLPIAHTPVHVPIINTTEFPVDRYLPPAEGILNMRVYDAVALKKDYKIMTAVEREFILEMGKESGKIEELEILDEISFR